MVSILEFINNINGSNLLELISEYPDQSVLLYNILNNTGNITSPVELRRNKASTSYYVTDADRERLDRYINDNTYFSIYGGVFKVSASPAKNNNVTIVNIQVQESLCM